MESNNQDVSQNMNESIQSHKPPIFENDDSMNVPAHKIVSLVIDLWKITERAKCEPVSERVLAACERAQERIKKIGFVIDEMLGRPYETNMRARVVGTDGGVEPFTISECLSPAIYYQGVLICEAEVITKGI